MMSVDDFRKMFGEDWQLSQFWSVPQGLPSRVEHGVVHCKDS